jgi:hypothetical protein
MSEMKHSEHQHGDPNGGSVHRASSLLDTAHRDWRVWTGVVLMLAAMMVYLMTNDLAWGLTRNRDSQFQAPSGN